MSDDLLPQHTRAHHANSEWAEWAPAVTISDSYRHRLEVANGYLADLAAGFGHAEALKRTGHTEPEALCILRWMGVLSGEFPEHF